jgi:flagellar biogenesis protein FliO
LRLAQQTWTQFEIGRLVIVVTIVAAVICLLHRPARAGDAGDSIAGSSTVNPASFQSPAANEQSSVNTAVALDTNGTLPASQFATAGGTSEVSVPPKAMPLAAAGRNDRSTLRIAASNPKVAVGSTSSTTQTVVTVLGSLGVVLGLFLLTMWLFRGSASKAGQLLPTEVVEPLGRTLVAKGEQLQLFRFGRKLVLVSHSSAGIETISEITDPVEVDRLSGLCHGKSPLSSSRAFQSLLDGFSGRGGSEGHRADSRRARSWDAAARAHARSRGDEDA